MKFQIKSIASLKVKGLILTILLSTLIHESVQAQSIPTIKLPNISVIKPGITVPKPTITVPNPTIPTPSVFQLPTNFVVNGAANNTKPSFVSVIKEGSNPPQIHTGTGSTSIAIPAATTTSGTVSNINVVLPSGNTVSSGDVNFNVDTTSISTFGSVINSVNLSFPVPVLD
ncbi:hypothetical protein [Dolichospermum sp. UHCC 0259]|uniref:hypothetical protein n=1 Tax=Dolichospermum sp. UHCC 0259 TaxID=2590010 RepID=UPI0014464869|nr:hypothetical protein [Dolichospermum sp. UHCC 0259]MTJ48985.1 hypothetical protein [Dolichospermum sp. UHCC 0259]